MTDLSADVAFAGRRRHIGKALYRHPAWTKDGLSERLFALLFSGLVYPQIWEDPEIDIAALEIAPTHRIVTIGSGGCNMLAYLTLSPARIDVVDLNVAHVALNRLKLAAIRHLPGHGDLFRFFGANGFPHNSVAYDRFLAPHLDAATRAWWECRDWRGRRRIAAFDRNFMQGGLLGFFIAAGHRIARLHGVDPAEILRAKSRADQRRFFEERLAPLFERRVIRWLTSNRASLFGLGIPPAQYDALVTAGDGTMASVLKTRLEKLACHFPLKDNYFAWQAFGRGYPLPGQGTLPRWLQAGHQATLREAAGRVEVHNAAFTDLLARKPTGSVDRFVLLDAQDWMTDEQLNALWSEITRTAAVGARVAFRTAAEPSLLPGRVADSTLSQWRYHEALSRDLAAKDRSAIYGGFHLYEKIA